MWGGIFLFLILEVNSLHAVADSRQNLVWNRVECVAEDGHWEVVTEDFNTITFLAINACYVNHGYVHTDVTDILCLLTIYQTIAVAVAKMAVQAVSIADWYCCNHAVVVDGSLARVAHSLTSWYVAQLKDSSLQRRDIIDCLVCAWVNTIKT